MARVMRAWEVHCTDPRLPRTLRPRLAGRFRVEKVVGYPIVNTRLGEDTYSDGIMRLLVEFVRRQKSLAAEELDAWADDLQTLSEQGRYFFALTRFLFLASKA